jgi:hypothetical protein
MVMLLGLLGNLGNQVSSTKGSTNKRCDPVGSPATVWDWNYL